MNKIGNTVKLLRITGIFFVAAMFSILPALNVCAKQITSGKGSYDFDGSGALCVYDMTDEDIKNILEQKKTTAIELNGCTITEPDTLNQDYLEIITLDNCEIKAKNFKFNENLENIVTIMHFQINDQQMTYQIRLTHLGDTSLLPPTILSSYLSSPKVVAAPTTWTEESKAYIHVNKPVENLLPFQKERLLNILKAIRAMALLS